MKNDYVFSCTVYLRNIDGSYLTPTVIVKSPNRELAKVAAMNKAMFRLELIDGITSGFVSCGLKTTVNLIEGKATVNMKKLS